MTRAVMELRVSARYLPGENGNTDTDHVELLAANGIHRRTKQIIVI